MNLHVHLVINWSSKFLTLYITIVLRSMLYIQLDKENFGQSVTLKQLVYKTQL